MLKPFALQLDTFKKQISEIHHNELKGRSDLMAEIRHLKDLNIKISTDADNLSKALKGNNKNARELGQDDIRKIARRFWAS